LHHANCSPADVHEYCRFVLHTATTIPAQLIHYECASHQQLHSLWHKVAVVQFLSAHAVINLPHHAQQLLLFHCNCHFGAGIINTNMWGMPMVGADICGFADMAFKEGGSPDMISEESLRELCNRCNNHDYYKHCSCGVACRTCCCFCSYDALKVVSI
jgi:hypothetical protein